MSVSEKMRRVMILRNEERDTLNQRAATLEGAKALQQEVFELTGESSTVQDAIDHLSKVYAMRRMNA